MTINIKITRGIALLSVPLLLAACGEDEEASEENVGEALDYTITGIEPGAGVGTVADEAVETYDNLDSWEIEESSTAGMLTLLDEAVQNEEPIVVVGWIPHYKFEMHDLKLLEDPEQVFGEDENFHTLTRLDIEEDMPEAHEVLDNFFWEKEDIQEIMLEGLERDYDEITAEWVEENQDRVDDWIDGVEEVDGETFELGSVPWDAERASSGVLGEVLEEVGYEVNITNVDPTVLYQALSQNEVDATAAAWLPTAQGAFLEEYGDGIIDLGPNLEGTDSGFVVPEYMEDIDSIEDLPSAE